MRARQTFFKIRKTCPEWVGPIEKEKLKKKKTNIHTHTQNSREMRDRRT